MEKTNQIDELSGYGRIRIYTSFDSYRGKSEYEFLQCVESSYDLDDNEINTRNQTNCPKS